MKCPHCQAEIKIFGKEWQNQRPSKEKHCPSCNGLVDMTFNGRKFAILLLPSLAFAFITFPLFGQWSLGISLAVILLPCAQFQKPK